MKTDFMLATVLLVASAASAQENELPQVGYPQLAGRAASAAAFAPSGWRVETQAAGDLNGDGVADLAFTLRTAGPVDTVTSFGMGAGRAFDSSPRILAVAFAERGRRSYRLAASSHTLIPRPTDPTEADWMFEAGSLAVSRGVLVVRLAHLQSSAGERTFRFRWQDRALRLIGYDFSDVHRYSHCMNTVSINFLTHRMRTAYAANEEAREQVRWRALAVRPLLALDQVGDGMAFDPERAVSSITC